MRYIPALHYIFANKKNNQEITQAKSKNESIRTQDVIIQNKIDNDNPIIDKTHIIDTKDTMNTPVTKVVPE